MNGVLRAHFHYRPNDGPQCLLQLRKCELIDISIIMDLLTMSDLRTPQESADVGKTWDQRNVPSIVAGQQSRRSPDVGHCVEIHKVPDERLVDCLQQSTPRDETASIFRPKKIRT